MKPKIVTVETIATREKHPNADRLHIYSLEGLGWQVISNVKYEPGDKAGFVHTDTVAPDNGEYEFLRDAKFRIKPIKLRGVLSNGMLIPIHGGTLLYPNGTEIGESFGFKKYIKPQPLSLGGDVAGPFPKSIVPQTDEERLQNEPGLIDELKQCGVAYATVKHDGSSATYIKEADGTFRVCSRNNELKDTEGNAFWRAARKYDLANSMPLGMAIQCELIGPKVQGNPEKLAELELRVFNVWNLDTGAFSSLPEIEMFCEEVGVSSVNVFNVYTDDDIPSTIAEYEAESRKVLYNTEPGEGLVWRPMYPRFSRSLQKNLSFKVINDNYKD